MVFYFQRLRDFTSYGDAIMSWLYTIIFSGLIFSSNPASVEKTETVVPVDVPVAAAPLVPLVAGDETERFEQTYPLIENGRVSVSNVNGSIVIEAWDRNEVKLVAVKSADTRERLADVEIKIDAKPEYINIETDYSDWKRRTGGERWNGSRIEVSYHLTVPRGAFLNEIETVNGSVTVSNFTNLTRVSAVNGTVKATNLRGTADLSTVNGEVAADFDRLDSGSKISLETVNGRVNLVIPSDANATIRADSLNGNISNDFGLPIRKGKYIGRDLYGKVGSGDVQIKLNSVNGGLAIGRKNDGKAPNSAKDLLPQKENDQDWNNDNDHSSIRKDRIDRDVAKAAKASKVVTKAIESSRSEMERVKPELDRVAIEAERSAAEILRSKAVQDSMKAELALKKDIMTVFSDANFRGPIPRLEKRSNSFPVKGVPKVTVDANDCNVKIIGTDASEVRYTLISSSIARTNDPIQVKEENNGSNIALRVIDPDPDASRGRFLGDRMRSRIEVYVPKHSNLKIVTDGEIRLEGVTGEIDLTGGDQSINIRDVDGSLRVGSLNGRVRVIGFRGDLDVRSAEGQLNLEGDFSKLSARTDCGDVILTLPNDTNADLETQETAIQADGIGVDRNDGSYRIGKGGKKFRITTEGEILVRGRSVLTAGL